jgi:hypothetical protein
MNINMLEVNMDIKKNVNICKYLLSLLDTYMGKYYEYYENRNVFTRQVSDNEDNFKKECIEITKQIHELMAQDCNIINIVSELPTFIDKHVNNTQNYDFVILAYGYIFKKDFFDYFLNLNLNTMPNEIKNKLHISLAQILIVSIETIYEYVEIENNNEEMLAFLLYEPICILKDIYNNLNKYQNLDYIKNNFIELMCEFDLEEIYTLDNKSIGFFENETENQWKKS